MTFYWNICPRCWSNPCQCTGYTSYYQAPPCEHCYCKPAAFSTGQGKHLQCCKCGTTMAEKFTKLMYGTSA